MKFNIIPNMNDIVLTIGITSYNRVNELKRALESIKCSKPEMIEILVSEDHSPKREEIREMVSQFAKESVFKVVFNSNEINQGYDRNLKRIITLSSGKYVFFLSDDDCLYPESVDVVLNCIEKEARDLAVVYGPFYLESTKEYRRFYKGFQYISKGGESAAKHIYDSILFSGLIYRKAYVENIDAEPFLNKNYFQVYMFLHCVYHYGGYYINTPIIRCVMDGENAYGFSDSAEKNPLLMDRKSPLSDLEFNKGLIEVIKMFDKENNTNTLGIYSREYNLRSYGGMARARRYGRKSLNEFFNKLKSVGIKINILPYVYYVMLYLFGSEISDGVMSMPRKLLLKLRREIR